MKEDNFEMSRNFLATDKVPESIFGIPIVQDESQYTEEDKAFFKSHPEAGGYYDLGDEQEEPAPEQGALKAKQSIIRGNAYGSAFSKFFESKPVLVRQADGKLYYKPTKDKAGKYDIGGYRSYWSSTKKRLVEHSNDGLLPEAAYVEGKKKLDAYFDSVTRKVYSKFGLDPATVDRGLDTVSRDIVFNTGGDDFLNNSPKFTKIVKNLVSRKIPAADAFGIALALEQDSYGWQNDRRFAARGGLVMDALSRSTDPTAKRFYDAYRTGWESGKDLHAASGDAFGTNWERHKAGMREAAKIADELQLEYSARGNK